MATTTWDLTGNTGNASNSFLGTTDGQPLVVKTSNAERLRIDSNGRVGVGIAAPHATLHVISIEGGSGAGSSGHPRLFPAVSVQSHTHAGLFAISDSGTGVDARSTSGIGAQALSQTNTGLFATSDSGIGVDAHSISGIGAQTQSQTNTGHHNILNQCPLLGVKRTPVSPSPMSALRPKADIPPLSHVSLRHCE